MAAPARFLVVVEGAVRMVVQDIPLRGGCVGGRHAVHVVHRHRRRRGSVLGSVSITSHEKS